MNATRLQSMLGLAVLTGMGFLLFLNAPAVRAQYTADFQTNTISNVTSNWTGDYRIGGKFDQLRIINSGVLSNGTGYLGPDSYCDHNGVLISDTGSVWSCSSFLYVGYWGSANTLVISNGGQLAVSWSISVGHYYTSSNNSLVVTGPGSVLNDSSDILYVGDAGVGNSLVIRNGGKVVDDSSYLGFNVSGGNNRALVADPGSVWSNKQSLCVGADGKGNNSLVISNGGRVVSGGGSVGGLSSNNNVLVCGDGSVWNCRGLGLGIGRALNSLVVCNGGQVIGSIQLGYWNNSLIISNGGQVVGQDSAVGLGLNGSNNSVLVTGAGTVWSNASLSVGNDGVGNSLVVNDGARIVGWNGTVGYSGSKSSVLVSGIDSIWSNRYNMTVGCWGTANNMVISNGAQVLSGNGSVGLNSGASNNSVRVADTAVWRSSLLRVGNQGSSNSLTVVGGLVFATNLIVGADSATCDNLVQLDSGSVIVTNGTADAVLEVRNGQFIQNGGVVQADVLVITNACARFIRNGGTMNVGNLLLDPNMSAVGDGIPNGWKKQHGLDPFDPNVGSEDADGDGMSNLQEFQAGTDPTNSASLFGVTSILTTGSDMLITWTMGSGKTNALQAAAAGDGGLYTNNFADVFAVTNTVGTTTNYLDAGAATNSPSRYYRVRLVP